MSETETRETAVTALAEVIDAADPNWEALDGAELAAAILNQPGVEIGVAHHIVTSALIIPAEPDEATHTQIVIRLPMVEVRRA